MTPPASVLFGRDLIRRRVAEVGEQIAIDYEGRTPILVSVLKGGAMFLSDLVRAIDLPLEVGFMAITRYGEAEESLGRVRILLDLDLDLEGRDVLLVEDIVDTGLTSRYLLSVLRARRPTSLEVCTLLDKAVRRIAPLVPRYTGFTCPDRFVIGYGLDLDERFRNLSDIFEVHDIDALRADPSPLDGRFTSGWAAA